jgi:hypothetical protein
MREDRKALPSLVGQGAANDLAQTPFLDPCDGLDWCQPDPFAEAGLGELIDHLRDLEKEDKDVTGDPILVVEVTTDRFPVEKPDEPRLLPGFLEGNLAGGLAWLQAALGNHPAFFAATGNQANLTETQRDRGRLMKDCRAGRHRAPAARGEIRPTCRMQEKALRRQADLVRFRASTQENHGIA